MSAKLNDIFSRLGKLLSKIRVDELGNSVTSFHFGVAFLASALLHVRCVSGLVGNDRMRDNPLHSSICVPYVLFQVGRSLETVAIVV